MTKGFPLDRGLREWLGADDEYNVAGERVRVGRSTTVRRRLERLRHRNQAEYCEFLVKRAVARAGDRGTDPTS